MAEPITSAEQLTPEWLTETLRLNGHLARGRVSRLGLAHFETLFSSIYRLEVTYSPDAAPALPRRLLLKAHSAGDEASAKMGRDEVLVYRVLREAMTDPPIVRCFSAAADSRGSHLLLEDLSETHSQPELPVPPSTRHCELCVEALAELHAFWWEHPRLGAKIGELFDETSLKGLAAVNRQALSGFFDYLGDRLSAGRRRAYEKAIEFVPIFWQRRLTAVERNTLIHGDAHVWNMLHPKDAGRGRVYLIDLATSNRIRPATNDLAYMMALQWYPERRARLEERLLRHYHAALLARGVENYSWEDCRLDYRYSIVMHLFTPVLQWSLGRIPATVWWNNLERISEAYKDLNCGELL
ncbi:MAG TPA: phosphotransferase [Pyrinomonadaceae bacterium]|nr:phosphotransferase [Pyrinomonadaceae bacterium]